MLYQERISSVNTALVEAILYQVEVAPNQGRKYRTDEDNGDGNRDG